MVRGGSLYRRLGFDIENECVLYFGEEQTSGCAEPNAEHSQLQGVMTRNPSSFIRSWRESWLRMNGFIRAYKKS